MSSVFPEAHLTLSVSTSQLRSRFLIIHRLEACKLLGWTEIEAVVADFDELTAKLAEIDENLRRNELTVLQQAQHLQRREQVLEQMGLRAPSHRPEKGETVSPLKTTDDIAQEVGLTGRSVQHRKQIANKITPGVQEVIAETAIADSTTQLLDLERRHLNVGQRSLIAVEILPELERIAKEKQLSTLKQNQSPTVEDNCPQRIEEAETLKRDPQSRDIAAKAVGIGSQAAKKGYEENSYPSKREP